MVLRFFLIFINLFVLIKSSCDTFKNVEVYVKEKEGKSYKTIVNGCLDENFANRSSIAELEIFEQDVIKLKRDSVNGLLDLKMITFVGCDIIAIEENALINLPNLNALIITGSSIVEFSHNTFNGLNVKLLNLSNNRIGFIDRLTFANMNDLTRLILTKNNLYRYDCDWFKRLRKLKVLELNKNKLRLIPNRAFYQNKKLIEIDLSENEINTIEDGAFHGLKSLSLLDLSHNHLKTLNYEIFSNKTISIETFNLAGNAFNYLSVDFFQNIRRMINIQLYGNPWKCPCLKRLEIELKARNVTIVVYRECRHLPKCVVVDDIRTSTCSDEYDHNSTAYYYRQLIALKERMKDTLCIRFD